MQFIHPFPARMAPSIALRILSKGKPHSQVLDPMMGSGTTLVSARLSGHQAFGVDTDPLAVLIASASVQDLDVSRCRREAAALLNGAQKRYRDIALADAYPLGADDETRAFVRYWFDPVARRQLTALTTELMCGEYRARKFLQVVISRMIIAKQGGVSHAIDVSHSRPHKRREGQPRRPFDVFDLTVNAAIKGAQFRHLSGQPKATAKRGDCRKLPFGDRQFDYVLTSPPYLNAIDYLRGHKLSLVWLNYQISELRTIRSTNVGADRGHKLEQWDDVVAGMVEEAETLPKKLLNMLRLYASDLEASLTEIRRVIRPSGELIIVIGDCTIRGTEIQNSKAVEITAKQLGFDRISKRRRPLPPNRRYLPPPTKKSSREQLRKRMRDEIILRFRA